MNVVRTVNVAITTPPGRPTVAEEDPRRWDVVDEESEEPAAEQGERGRGEPLAVDDRRGEEDRRGDQATPARPSMLSRKLIALQIITIHTTVNTAEVACRSGCRDRAP